MMRMVVPLVLLLVRVGTSDSGSRTATSPTQKALELQPNSRNALLCLVYLEIRGGNLDAAREKLASVA